MFHYQIPAGVTARELDGRPALTTPQGGLVALDANLLKLWEQAPGLSTAQVVLRAPFNAAAPLLRAGLACLCEAGLLARVWDEPAPAAAPAAPVELPGGGELVSAVIVGYNSREWLDECLPSLLEQSYQPLEIVFVDNGSSDDSLAYLTVHYPPERFPQVRVLVQDPPGSLSQAINAGVAAARGAYYLILNPDVRLHRQAVAWMVQAAASDPRCGAVGVKLLFWWAPSFLNGLGNRVGSFSWGSDNGLGHLDLGQFDDWRELPSACFAATLVTRPAWQAAGPADERFPMYYEDSEFSYRLRLLGYKALAAPQARVYHAFGGRIPTGKDDNLSPRKLRNVIYGRYRFALKLTGEKLGVFLRNYWLEDWANFTRLLARRDLPAARAYLGGWNAVLRSLPELLASRRDLQHRRQLDDQALFALQQDMPMTFAWRGLPELTMDLVANHYYPLIRSGRTRPMPEFDRASRRPHLLIVSNDVVAEKMAGPGMRYLEMALALKDDLDVTLAIPSESNLVIPGVNLARYWEQHPGSLQVLIENCDVALVSGYMIEKFPFLNETKTRLVVDLYDPFVLENLHYYLDEPLEAQEQLNRQAINISNSLVRLGDFLICGNERQRDFWLGMLAANGRINPRTFDQDASLRALIAVVGIGFPDRELSLGAPVVRGVYPQVGADNKLVLWGGGIWNWLDPLTLVRAWPAVLKVHPDARLVFLGTRHPNPLVPVHAMARQTEQLAEEIGEKERSIIFIEWVAYTARETLLNEADVGVALHPIHVETRYSIRTRILDYLWARLPVLITDGDVTSEWVRQYDLGRVVPPHDPAAVAQALIELLDRPKAEWAPAFEPLMSRFRWKQVVQPLLEYCQRGAYAPDRATRFPQAAPAAGAPPVQTRWARAMFIWRTEGTRALLHRTWRYIQWRLSRP